LRVVFFVFAVMLFGQAWRAAGHAPDPGSSSARCQAVLAASACQNPSGHALAPSRPFLADLQAEEPNQNGPCRLSVRRDRLRQDEGPRRRRMGASLSVIAAVRGNCGALADGLFHWKTEPAAAGALRIS